MTHTELMEMLNWARANGVKEMYVDNDGVRVWFNETSYLQTVTNTAVEKQAPRTMEQIKTDIDTVITKTVDAIASDINTVLHPGNDILFPDTRPEPSE